jgi:hypothetical protein
VATPLAVDADHLGAWTTLGGGVGDETWHNAAKQGDEDQLAALVSLSALINFSNRVTVLTRQPAGDVPGQWADVPAGPEHPGLRVRGR